MADFRPTEAAKARILSVHPAPDGTPIEGANGEWIEIQVTMSSDLANWRVQHLRPLWKEEVAKPVEWEWVYTFGSPALVREGEIYRVHSGSRVRGATHPLPDDLAPGRRHVYMAGPVAAAKLLWARGDYARLLDAFGTVIDEIVVWPSVSPPPGEPAKAR